MTGDDPQSIALAGDWHANTAWARRAIDHAHQLGAQHIVHLGDFGYDFDPGYLIRVNDALFANDLHLWFIDGNHENFNKLNRYPIEDDGRRHLTSRIHHLPRGYRWEWHGVRFLAVGGAHSVDRPFRVTDLSWWPQEWLTDDDIANAINGGPVDVLISHDCPTGVDIPGLDGNPHGFPELEIMRANEHRQRLATIVAHTKPKMIYHGHYHVAYQTVARLNHGHVQVRGLDCDGTSLDDNIAICDLTGDNDERLRSHNAVESR
jgi:predicted phosphodiesterase